MANTYILYQHNTSQDLCILNERIQGDLLD